MLTVVVLYIGSVRTENQISGLKTTVHVQITTDLSLLRIPHPDNSLSSYIPDISFELRMFSSENTVCLGSDG